VAVEAVAGAGRVVEDLADLVGVIGGDAAEEAAPARRRHADQAVMRRAGLIHHQRGRVQHRIGRIHRARPPGHEGGRARRLARRALGRQPGAAGDREVSDAGGVGDARVEAGGARGRQVAELRAHVGAVAHGGAVQVGHRAEHLLGVAGQHAEHHVGHRGAGVWGADAGHGGHQIGSRMSHPARVEAALRVADEVHLLAGAQRDTLDEGEQLRAAHVAGVERVDL